MSKKKFVPSGCQLLCDKGAMPTPLTVTSNNSKIYGDKVATETDVKPGENIQPFGACSLKNGAPCSFAPLYWDKCARGVKIKGQKLVLGDANLMCAQGGKIAIFYSKADAMAAASKIASSPMIGVGKGIINAENYLNNNFARIARELDGVDPSTLANTTLKGNFGELRTELDMKMRGYQITSNSQAATVQGGGHQGLDLAAKDGKGTRDILVESKYKSGNGKPHMGNAPRSGGRQMGRRWLLNNRGARIRNAIPNPDDAARITNKVRTGSSDLTKLSAKVTPEGNVTYYELDAQGRTGNLTDLPAANVAKGNSKAANAINNISRNIQANSKVAAANRWMVGNSHKIARVGRVAGRVFFVVGVAAEVYNISNAYEADGGKIGDNTKKAIGSAAGGLAGGIAGAKVGAMIGAIGGPVGIVVGGIIGGAIGGLLGAWGGGKVGGFF